MDFDKQPDDAFLPYDQTEGYDASADDQTAAEPIDSTEVEAITAPPDWGRTPEVLGDITVAAAVESDDEPGADMSGENSALGDEPGDEPAASAGDGPSDIPPTDRPPAGDLNPEDDGSFISPELADSLFEIVASESPPTPEEQNVLRRHHEGTLAWLGDYNYRPRLMRTFNEDTAEPGSREGTTLSAERAEAMTAQQLQKISDSLGNIENSINVTSKLAELTQQHAGRTVVQKSAVWDRDDVYYLPDHVVTRTEDGSFEIEDRPDFMNAVRGTEYVQYDHPDGETRLIRSDSTDRYCLKPGNDGTMTRHGVTYTLGSPEKGMITHETIRTLPADSPEYFKELNGLLKTHKELLLQAATAVGEDRDTLVDPDTSGLRPDATYLMYKRLKGQDIASQVSADIRSKLADNTAVIWQTIAYSRTRDAVSGRMVEQGLAPRGRVVNAYFEAVMLHRQ